MFEHECKNFRTRQNGDLDLTLPVQLGCSERCSRRPGLVSDETRSRPVDFTNPVIRLTARRPALCQQVCTFSSATTNGVLPSRDLRCTISRSERPLQKYACASGEARSSPPPVN